MIWTVFTICFLRLVHNRVEMLLAFVVPIAFFSIFAIIFGGGVGSGSTPSIKVVAVDTVRSDQSRQIVAALRDSAGLRFVNSHDEKPEPFRIFRQDAVKPDDAVPTGQTASPEPADPAAPNHEGDAGNHAIAAVTVDDDLTPARATAMVRRGTAAMAIVLRKSPQGGIKAELLSDSSDQVAPQVVSALVQRAMMTMAPPVPPSVPDGFASPASTQKTASLKTRVASDSQPSVGPPGSAGPTGPGFPASSNIAAAAGAFSPLMPTSVEIVDVLGDSKSNPVVTMYAAGIAVMFLLFGATAGGGALLEERENQTLDRLLTTGLSMDQLLLGKWLYLTLLGVTQTTLMFAWGQLVFGVDLLGHFDGFLIMTLVTAGAAAAFGLLLATLCKTRGQLNGLSVVVVLTMSALGGSMVPRYVMSQSLRDAGLWTFNAWALDGYDKVFWRELPAGELWPQMGVLMVCGAVFLVTARIFAIRWETE
jgi:ABC-2 type transport system permease protein